MLLFGPCASVARAECRKMSREEKRRQRRASAKYRLAHATRERMRVEVRKSLLTSFESINLKLVHNFGQISPKINTLSFES